VVRLAEYLEAVADAKDRLAFFHVTTDSGHYRREAGDGASPQVVAVREAARQDDAVVGGEVAFPVPDEVRLVSHHFGERPLTVAVAPGAGEDDDGEAHDFRVQEPGARSQIRSDMTGMDPAERRSAKYEVGSTGIHEISNCLSVRRLCEYAPRMASQAERSSVAADIEAIFHPHSIAVVGASASPDTPGYDYVRSLQEFG